MHRVCTDMEEERLIKWTKKKTMGNQYQPNRSFDITSEGRQALLLSQPIGEPGSGGNPGYPGGPPDSVSNGGSLGGGADRRRIIEVKRINKSVVLTTASVLAQIEEYLDQISLNNKMCVDHPEHIDFVKELKENLEKLIEHTPIDDDAKPIEEVEQAESRLENIARLVREDIKKRTTDEEIAGMVVPIGIVLGCVGIGSLVGSVAGFGGMGVGFIAGKFLTGEAKSGASLEKIQQSLEKEDSVIP